MNDSLCLIDVCELNQFSCAFRSYKPGMSLNWLVLTSNHFFRKRKLLSWNVIFKTFSRMSDFSLLESSKRKMLQRKSTMINDAICYFYEQLFFLDLKPLWAWMNISLIKNLNKSKQWIVWWRTPLIPNIYSFFGNLLVERFRKLFLVAKSSFQWHKTK